MFSVIILISVILSYLLFIRLLFDCSLVFRAVYTVESVFAMLTKNEEGG